MARSKDSQAQRRSGPDDLYALFLAGLPNNVGWQDIKDLVRKACPNIRLKHADIMKPDHGLDGVISHTIINGRDQAEKAYKYFLANGYTGKSITVSLASAEYDYQENQYAFQTIYPIKQSPAPRGKTLTNPNGPSQPTQSTVDSRRSSIAGAPYVPGMPNVYTNPAQYCNQYPSMIPQQFPTSYSFSQASITAPTAAPINPMLVMQMGAGQTPSGQTMPSPGFSPTLSGPTSTLPQSFSNLSLGPKNPLSTAPTGPTQHRTVFIRNLDSSITWQQLKDRMRTVGEVSRCEVKPENVQKGNTSQCRPPRSWGIVIFVDRSSADRAIQVFDGCEWINGYKMRVNLSRPSSHQTHHQSSKSSSSNTKPNKSFSNQKLSRGGACPPPQTNKSLSNPAKLTSSIHSDRSIANSASSTTRSSLSGGTGCGGGAPLVIDGNKARYSGTEDEDEDSSDEDEEESEEDEEGDGSEESESESGSGSSSE
ncbi:putative rna binding protein [Phaeomoniella chlamydospora]|uniref:Putative rna binding protein n=1 Tax=Phaeomoniella chlamydospora TaxID=158046 RepID=A0A0G2GNK5_PHACM|nr:putative rna binding protein [Phaeomoniella chlamydospora]